MPSRSNLEQIPEKPEKAKPIGPALQRLVLALREHQAKCYEITEEIDRLLGGGIGVAELVKRTMAAFERAWASRYAPDGSTGYVWSATRDVPHIKRLLRQLTPADLEQRFGRYVTNEDPFYVSRRHPFAAFVASINSHTARATAPTPVAWTCPDTPVCPVGTSSAVCRSRADINVLRRQAGRPLLGPVATRETQPHGDLLSDSEPRPEVREVQAVQSAHPVGHEQRNRPLDAPGRGRRPAPRRRRPGQRA